MMVLPSEETVVTCMYGCFLWDFIEGGKSHFITLLWLHKKMDNLLLERSAKRANDY